MFPLPGAARRSSEESELMSNVFRPNDKLIDILKIITAIWESSERNVRIYSDLLREYLNDKRTFNEIEFYLPQIAHMIIHLGNTNLELARGLERLMLSICQLSMHTALQLTFIFKAALEDYQMELPNGKPNPASNPALFNKCAVLLEHIERVVVFGSSPVLVLDMAKNDKIIGEVVMSNTNEDVSRKGALIGELLYKRNTRKAFYRSKPWKPRFFKVENQALFCYHDDTLTKLLRCISLLDARLEVPTAAKHLHYMELHSTVNDTVLRLRANDSSTFNKWAEAIEIEINKPPKPIKSNRTVSFQHARAGTTEDDAAGYSANDLTGVEMYTGVSLSKFKMSVEEEARFNFFRGQMKFVKDLTDISESLRFLDRDIRKEKLKEKLGVMDVPSVGYLPLCKSTDPFTAVLKPLPSECHAFSTKARCPALVLFELEQHPTDKDVATFEASELNYTYEDSAAIDVDSQRLSKYKPTPAPATTPEVDSVWREESNVVVERIIKGVTKFVSVSKADAAPSAKTSEPVSLVTGGNVSVGDKAETFADKAKRLRAASKFGSLPGWRLGGLIAKSNDDVRQEVFVMQLIMVYQRMFKDAGLPVWLYTYRILSTSKTTGLIELITDCISLDGLKKKDGYPGSLRQHFETVYKDQLDAAIGEYVKSMAAYSIVTYLLAIKDRHNGNIMIDAAGHIVHIDFGFVFGLAPGKQFSLEKAPWKLTVEMVEVMGGLESAHYKRYVELLISTFKVARAHSREVEALMDIMAHKSNYPAFKYNPNAIADFHEKLRLDVPDEKVPDLIDALLKKSYNYRGTRQYDSFQKLTNKIEP